VKRVSMNGEQALQARMSEQVATDDPAAALPRNLESFLAHLRLLVGVPFEYLVPDARLLPKESIRFFYLDRSWTDRLIDGALAVGKFGSREQAHHQGHHETVRSKLDVTERAVRSIQRGVDFADARNEAAPIEPEPEGRVTGFLFRSAVVSGWPQMDVRAYDTRLEEPLDSAAAQDHRIRLLRLERLSPSVMFGLFDGVPKLVIIEEPHHGVQLGIEPGGTFGFSVRRRNASGVADPDAAAVDVPIRRAHPRVLGIAQLRQRLHALAGADADAPPQGGSADLAIQLLRPPWRQRFEQRQQSVGGFAPVVAVAERVSDERTRNILEELLQ
jgi:hypothetical protein